MLKIFRSVLTGIRYLHNNLELYIIFYYKTGLTSPSHSLLFFKICDKYVAYILFVKQFIIINNNHLKNKKRDTQLQLFDLNCICGYRSLLN